MKTANKNTRGILMFAHNNQEIDYIRLAMLNSLLAQKHLGLTSDQVTIVTDEDTMTYAQSTFDPDELERASTNYIITETDYDFKYKNTRTYKDTSLSPKTLPFYNVNRADAYDLSPYDETILVDSDYLILSNSLNNCWGHNNELMMNWEYKDVATDRRFPDLDRLNPLGITMYWATVVYFRKTAEAETFFNFVKHVRNNRDYYADLYKFRNSIYRNDFSFSIAAHMWGGYIDKALPQLPVTLYKTFDNDDIYDVKGDCIYLYAEKAKAPGDFSLIRWQGTDIHIMNKWAIGRVNSGLISYALSENKQEEPFWMIRTPLIPGTMMEVAEDG